MTCAKTALPRGQKTLRLRLPRHQRGRTLKSCLNARGLAKNKHRRRQTKLTQRDSVMTCGPFAVLVATAVFHPRKFGTCHSTANIPVEGCESWQKDPDTRRRPSYPVSDRWRTRNEKRNERTAPLLSEQTIRPGTTAACLKWPSAPHRRPWREPLNRVFISFLSVSCVCVCVARH